MAILLDLEKLFLVSNTRLYTTRRLLKPYKIVLKFVIIVVVLLHQESMDSLEIPTSLSMFDPMTGSSEIREYDSTQQSCPVHPNLLSPVSDEINGSDSRLAETFQSSSEDDYQR